MTEKKPGEMALPPELRSKQGIEKLAEQYPDEYRKKDREIQEMMRSAVERETDGRAIGHLTRNELLKIGRWKSSGRRNDHHVMSNREIDVIERSHRAFADEDYRHLIRPAPKGLKGVGLRTDTAIMHFAFPKKYPIIDENALLTLGIEHVSHYGSTLWRKYRNRCLEWAEKYTVDLRTLDRALWQYGAKLKKQKNRGLDANSV